MTEKIRIALIILLLALLYFLLGKFAFIFAISYKTVTSAIFFSEGVALAFILLYGKKVWPGIFIGQMLLAATTDLSLAASIFIAAGNSIEALAGFCILKKMKISKSIDSLRDYLILVFVIFGFLQPLSAVFGVSTLYFFGVLSAPDILSGFTYWWIGNSMGQLLFTPLLLAVIGFLRKGQDNLKDKISASIISAISIGFVSILIFCFWGTSVALQNIHAFFLILPVVIILALKYDFTGAVTSSLVISIIAQIFTVKHAGPFTGVDVQSNLISLNVFIISITLSAGFTGILFYERKQNEIRLQQAVNEIRTLQGILPICSYCKKIRNDEGSWEQLESYIMHHSEAEFSHGLCNDCYEKYYADKDSHEGTDNKKKKS